MNTGFDFSTARFCNNLTTYNWIFTAQCYHSVFHITPNNLSSVTVGSECVPVWRRRVSVRGSGVCSCLTWPVSERSGDTMTTASSSGRASSDMRCVKVVLVDAHLHASVALCACITGTFTCTQSSPFKVVRKPSRGRKYNLFGHRSFAPDIHG